MTIDIWLFLLIFAAIVVGWILGRFGNSSKSVPFAEDKNFAESYAQGLNYLIADDSDKAIQVFTRLIEVDSETIEIHVTLGNLFRSRGEVDKAIKIHQSLLARPNLTRSQRHLVITELAEDFSKAGLLDRAEGLYRELIDLKSKPRDAYKRLLDLYITGKSWKEAVECAGALDSMGEDNAAVIMSQCFCELAEEAQSNYDSRSERLYLDKALAADEQCVRASLILIERFLKNKQPTQARTLLKKLVRNNPEYIDLFIQPAHDIYLQDRNSAGYLKFLKGQYKNKPRTRIAIALLEYYAANQSIDKAQEFLELILKESPSFEIFEFAMRFLKSKPDQLEDTWNRFQQYLDSMKQRSNNFVCHNCGYESHSIQWNCPSCRSWITIKPK